jgi:polysaccharide biosynthesis/export protein
MKNTFLVLIIFSIFLTGTVVAQDGTVASAAKPKQVNDIEPPKGHVFGPGDEISGKIIGEAEYNFVAVVDENGRIELPFAKEPIIARCKTEKELKADITGLLEVYLKNPAWTLRTEKRVRPPVTVFGEVVSAAKIDLTRKATLLEMLAVAGGPTRDAGRIVQVYRPQPMACSAVQDPLNWAPESGDASEVPSRFYKLSAMNQGQQSDNPVIIPGDVIYVPQATPVYIVGEVRQPGSVLLKKDGGTTLFDAITMVGGSNPQAKTKDVKIYRKKPGSGEKEVIAVNLDLIKKGTQKDIFLEPYDMIVVDKTKKSIALIIAEFAIGAGKQVISSAANTGGMRVMY